MRRQDSPLSPLAGIYNKADGQEVDRVIQQELIGSVDECDRDSLPYLQELGISIVPARQKIQFTHNAQAPVHRWSPYVQGFSAEFVHSTILRYWADYDLRRSDGALVHDPFAGSGTVLVEAKRMGVRRCTGTELNPLLAFLANTKVRSWDSPPALLVENLARLDRDAWRAAPDFLASERQFAPEVLTNLQILRGAIDRTDPEVRDLFRVALAAILIHCSRLTRAPCLGYARRKMVAPDAPWVLLRAKINQMAEDLASLQSAKDTGFRNNLQCNVEIADATIHQPRDLALAITSPPYMNGLDYVMNYKIEMAWLDFTNSRREAKAIKDALVVCDNVSKRVTADFAAHNDKYTDPWLTRIVERITENITHWDDGRADRRIPRRRRNHQPETEGAERPRRYRREDMPVIVHKYFDDMYKVMVRIRDGLIGGGRFVLVVGDSYIADVYVPTDLLLAKMGATLGLEIESIEKARRRRSGQIMSYHLRETIVTLRKPKNSGTRCFA